GPARDAPRRLFRWCFLSGGRAGSRARGTDVRLGRGPRRRLVATTHGCAEADQQEAESRAKPNPVQAHHSSKIRGSRDHPARRNQNSNVGSPDQIEPVASLATGPEMTGVRQGFYKKLGPK